MYVIKDCKVQKNMHMYTCNTQITHFDNLSPWDMHTCCLQHGLDSVLNTSVQDDKGFNITWPQSEVSADASESVLDLKSNIWFLV